MKAEICVTSVLWMSMLIADAYYPDEMDCPESFHAGIHSFEYMVPYGAPYRAWRTLPWRYFLIKPSTIADAGLGVFAVTFIAAHVWLGEYEGQILHFSSTEEEEDADLNYAWESYCDDEVVHFIDAKDIHVSNWLRFVNNPNHVIHQNVESHVCFGKIFYMTSKAIYPGQELFVYYGDDYAEYLGINLTDFFNIGTELISEESIDCEDCNTSWWWW